MADGEMVSPQELANLKRWLGLPAWAQRKHVYIHKVKADPEKPDKKNIGKSYYMWGRNAWLIFKDQLNPKCTVQRKAFSKKFNFGEVVPFPKKEKEWERMGKPDPELQGEEVEEDDEEVVAPTPKRKAAQPASSQPATKKQKTDDPVDEEDESYAIPKTPEFDQ